MSRTRSPAERGSRPRAERSRGLSRLRGYRGRLTPASPGRSSSSALLRGSGIITNAATGDSQVKGLGVRRGCTSPEQGQTPEGLTAAGSCFAAPQSDLPNVLDFVRSMARRRAWLIPRSSRACSQAASPTDCRRAKARSSPPPNGRSRPWRSPTSQDHRRGRRSRAGRWSASPTTSSPRLPNSRWRPRARPHHQGRRPSPLDDLRSRRGGKPDHPGSQRHVMNRR